MASILAFFEPASEPDDRVLAPTRAIAAVIVPISLLAWVILYLFPDRTGSVFAWTIRPRLTAMCLGAAYLGGVYVFARVLVARCWHRVGLAFLPVAAFAALLGIATVLHWDRFRHGHVPFQVWAGLYFTTPFLVLGAWALNRRADPGTTETVDLVIAQAFRVALAATGVLTLAVAAFLFLAPHAMMDVWPWQLTPLTARVWAAMFALTGLTDVSIARDGRWSAARLVLHGQVIAVGLMDVALLLCRDDLDPSRPLTWVLVPGLALMGIGGLVLLLVVDRRRAPRAQAVPTGW